MNGIIIINKPKGYTSHDVVAKVKKILNIKKVGHTGTLDPNATGVLPLLLNQGTKLSKYLIEHDKQYEVTLKLGIKTDTADGEGTILQTEKVNWEIVSEKLEEVIKSMIGKQEQIPPMYSAIKVKGKKLYEYARSGQIVEVEPRTIEIYEINRQTVEEQKNEVTFTVSCSKGTYIRSLCEEIARKLGTIGYMKELNRIQVGRFELKDSVTIEELEKGKEQVEEKIITMQELFKDLPTVSLEEKEYQPFLNGVKIVKEVEDGMYNIYQKEYIGIGIVKGKRLKRDIILE